jgi:hypothetical protein
VVHLIRVQVSIITHVYKETDMFPTSTDLGIYI